MIKHAQKRKKPPTLAKAGDPLVTAGGITINPDVDEGEVPTKAQDKKVNARSFKAPRQRAIKDLPATPTMMKAVSCVFMLTALGITEREAAAYLNLSPGDLRTVKRSPVYTECFNEVLQALINANSDMLNARIASYASDAVDRIATIAQTAKKEETRLSANRDIADRAGIGVKGTGVQIAGLGNGELRIQFIEPDKTKDVMQQ